MSTGNSWKSGRSGTQVGRDFLVNLKGSMESKYIRPRLMGTTEVYRFPLPESLVTVVMLQQYFWATPHASSLYS